MERQSTLLTPAKEAENFVPFEIVIQKITIVKYIGVYGQRILQEVVPVPVNFDDVHRADGLISKMF